MGEPVVLAQVIRSGMIEGVHMGHAVVMSSDGSIVESWGDPSAIVYPRSSNKPVQATALVRCGLRQPQRLVALAASSHSGEEMHISGVREILATHDCDDRALQTPADYPLDAVERDSWVAAGRAAEPIAMNCSGKHASMIDVCIRNGWDRTTYRSPDHPVQLAIAREVEMRAGESVAHVGMDGCGAPVLALSLVGLARSVSALVTAPEGDPGRIVVDAMRSHPQMVGGTRREVTSVMQAVPGLVAKDGADGVYVGALDDGAAFAIKVLDGAERARTVALAAVLTAMGWAGALEPWRTVPVLGHGSPVGEVRSPLLD